MQPRKIELIANLSIRRFAFGHQTWAAVAAAAVVCMLVTAACFAQQPVPPNPAWPDPLVLLNGSPVQSRVAFEDQRRPEILRLFEENLYGRTPKQSLPVRVTSSQTDDHALGGLAKRTQITIAVGPHGERTWHLLLYTPASAHGPVPVIVGLNFNGNQTVSADPGIQLNPVWIRDPALGGVPLAKEQSRHILALPGASTRGVDAHQWQVEMLLSRGYGLATLYAGEIEPDFLGGIGYGIRPLFFDHGQSMPGADDWGAIGAWAWGMSRIVDVLAAYPQVNPGKLIAFGFSRFGKTALWAAAQDKRFALVISNESGQAGATLSHRQTGESIDHLMLAFPYWFCANYQHFLGRTQDFPLDGHLLLSLIAPRPLDVGSALDDPYSDHEGEFLAAQAVGPVYALYGEHGIPALEAPPFDKSIGETVAYHLRHGGHDVTAFDWERYLNFADREFHLSR
jgi:hypothetical protein